MENKTEQFLMVPHTILQNKELKDSDKMTLALIYSFRNNNKEVYISNNKLGFMLGVSRTTASERITKLETLGYIKCERVMVNGKERRTIVPLKMVGSPNRLVGTPNPLVGTPNGISRYSDTSLVGGVGSIIYPILDNELNKISDNELNKEKTIKSFEYISTFKFDLLSEEERNQYLINKFNHEKQLQNEQNNFN